MSTFLAYILLGEHDEPKSTDIRDFLNEHWEDLAPESFSSEVAARLIAIGHARAVLMHMPAPFPWGELEEACATSALWDDATEALRDHKAHIVVSILGESDAREEATLLTQVTAAVLHACPSALGVYWDTSDHVIEKDMFNHFAVNVMPTEVPMHMWVNFRIGEGENGGSSGLTAGLEALGHLEIEALNSPETPDALRDRLTMMGLYLLTAGPVINDGDTISAEGAEKISVIFTDSQFGYERQVMLLEYESVDSE